MSMLSLDEIAVIRKVITGLTLILTICSVSLKLVGIYPRFNIACFFVLGLFFFLAIIRKKESNDSDNFFLATLIVGDATYILSLFFLLGRSFIDKL